MREKQNFCANRSQNQKFIRYFRFKLCYFFVRNRSHAPTKILFAWSHQKVSFWQTKYLKFVKFVFKGKCALFVDCIKNALLTFAVCSCLHSVRRFCSTASLRFIQSCHGMPTLQGDCAEMCQSLIIHPPHIKGFNRKITHSGWNKNIGRDEGKSANWVRAAHRQNDRVSGSLFIWCLTCGKFFQSEKLLVFPTPSSCARVRAKQIRYRNDHADLKMDT